MKSVVGAISGLLLVTGCRPAPPPSASGAILQMIDEDDAEALEKEAPQAFAKASRYAKMSEEQEKAGDEQEAKRYLHLSRYYLKIAKLSQKKQSLEAEISAVHENNARLDADIANTEMALDKLTREAERKRFRAYVESVIDETRRRAAAEETVRERGYTGDEKRAIRRAREQLGAALIERARLFSEVLSFSVPESTSRSDFLAPVEGPISAAEAALEELDLAQVQYYLEAAGVAYQQTLSDIWQQSPFDPVAHTRSLSEELRQGGFSIVTDDMGVSIRLPESSAPGAYAELVSILSRYPDVALLLLASWRGAGEPMLESERLARRIASSITAAGFPGERLRVRAVGEAAPLAVLKEREVVSVLLLIPCPEP